MSTFTGQVSGGTDDGAQVFSTNNVVLTDATDAFKNSSGFKTYGAWRFQNVTIPPGATISAANLSFWTAANNSMNSTIYGNLVANPSTLSNTNSYISNLASTIATVAWNPSSSAVGGFNNTADITSIISELIGQAGWASGNAMLFVLQVTGGGAYAITQYDGTPGDAAEISITYTALSPPGTPQNLVLSTLSPTSTLATWVQGSGTVQDNLIRYSPDNSTWTTVDLGAVSTSTSTSGLTTGTRYFFQVAASNSGGQSAWSPSASWITGDDGSRDGWAGEDSSFMFGTSIHRGAKIVAY
jgi:hypothetical protein